MPTPADLRALLEDADALTVVCHNNLDPDCLASALALGRVAADAGIDERRILYSGDISHQQNRAFVNLLELDLQPFEPRMVADRPAGSFLALVDHSVPGENNRIPEGTPVNIVIDHHPADDGQDRFVDHREEVGATATILPSTSVTSTRPSRRRSRQRFCSPSAARRWDYSGGPRRPSTRRRGTSTRQSTATCSVASRSPPSAARPSTPSATPSRTGPSAGRCSSLPSGGLANATRSRRRGTTWRPWREWRRPSSSESWESLSTSARAPRTPASTSARSSRTRSRTSGARAATGRWPAAKNPLGIFADYSEADLVAIVEQVVTVRLVSTLNIREDESG